MRHWLLGFACSLVLACGNSSPPASPGGDGGTSSPDSGTTENATTETFLRDTVGYLAADERKGRDEGTPESAEARRYLVEKLTACGVEPGNGGSFEQPITTGKGVNILGSIPGTTRRERTIIVSAHYDHVGVRNGAVYTGADDNAAGVAVTLSVACALAKNKPERSVLVALWDAEEPPTFLSAGMGSQFYATQPVVPLDRTDAVIVSDLVGSNLWDGFRGHFIMGAELSPELRDLSSGVVAPPKGLDVFYQGLHIAEETPLGMQPWSDYDAFRGAGVPFLFFSNGQTKRYHTPQDRPDTLDYAKMALEAAHMTAIVRHIAALPVERVRFDAQGQDYKNDAKVAETVLQLALDADKGVEKSLGAGAAMKRALEGDLAAVRALRAKLDRGESVTSAELRTLRNPGQRLMCFAQPSGSEQRCTMF